MDPMTTQPAPSPRRTLLPVLSGPCAPALRTRVLASASELPAAPVTGAVALEINVQLLDLGDGAYCLNHALRQRQLYGGEIVRGAFEAASAGRAPESSALRDALVEHGFVVRPGEAPEREHRRLLEAEDTRVAGDPSFTLLRILLTDICNLACTYCKVIPNVDSPITDATSPERLREVIRFFFTYSEEERPKIIHITGGEPTLFFDRIELIVRSAEEFRRPRENFWFVLGTNATHRGVGAPHAARYASALEG